MTKPHIASDLISEADAEEPVSRLPQGYFLRIGYAEDGLNLFELWVAVVRRKWLILGVTLAFASLAAGVSATIISPRYAGEVVVAPVNKAASSETNDDSIDLTSLLPASVGEALGLIESRSFIRRFVEEGDLLPILFAKKWDSQAGDWRDPNDIPTYLDAYEEFTDDILSNETDVDSDFITITVSWTDPKLAAEWANKIVADINAILRQRAIDEAERNIEYLRSELAKTDSLLLKAALHDQLEIQLAIIVAANVQLEFVFRVMDPAVVPEKPSIPFLRAIVVAVGVFLGLFFGVALALFLNTMQVLKTKSESRVRQSSA